MLVQKALGGLRLAIDRFEGGSRESFTWDGSSGTPVLYVVSFHQYQGVSPREKGEGGGARPTKNRHTENAPVLIRLMEVESGFVVELSFRFAKGSCRKLVLRLRSLRKHPNPGGRGYEAF